MTDTTDSQALLDRLVPIIRTTQYCRWAATAAWVIVVWDYILCFEKELRLIWKRKKTILTLLYIAVRYNSLISVTLYVWSPWLFRALFHQPQVTQGYCFVWMNIEGFLAPLAWAPAQGILVLRVHALYGNSRKVFWFLIAASCLTSIGMLATWGAHHNYSKSVIAQPLPGPTYWVCRPQTPASWLWLFWVFPALFETLICGMVITKAFATFRDRADRSSLLNTLFRDSVLYFIAILVLEFVTTGIWAYAQGIELLMMQASAAFSAGLWLILCCHLVLNLREEGTGSSTTTAVTTIRHEIELNIVDGSGKQTPRHLDSMGFPQISVF